MHEPIDTWASRPLKLIHAELRKIWSLPAEERYRHFKYANEFPSLFYQLSCTSKSLTSKEFDNLRVPTYDLSTLDPQDILDLPFWKFRWQIYELWAIVKSLSYLEGFGFELLFSHDGKFCLEQGRKAMLAKRHVPPLGYAYAQSNFQNVEGKDVHPDLVISTCGNIDALQPEDIALIIEAKQRKNSGSFEPHRKKHFEDVLNKYSKSTRHGGATVILNYDALPEQLEMPKETLALSEFYPGKADECQFFGFMQKHLPEWASNYRDSGKKIIVLDYSTSMQWVGFHKAREELKKFQQLWPEDTFTYGTAEDRFFPLTNNEIFDEEYPSTLWGAERAETLAKGILNLPDRDNISHVVFLTDL
ncbi:MAG: hypothetical protein C0490_27065, partial [Marivirga sp.]|nr:hypothetical protein [Marivirga sp.]